MNCKTQFRKRSNKPTVLLKLNRQHWQIENPLHRTKDVTFKEDASTIHKDNAPHSMAALRNAAVTFIKNFSEPAIKKK